MNLIISYIIFHSFRVQPYQISEVPTLLHQLFECLYGVGSIYLSLSSASVLAPTICAIHRGSFAPSILPRYLSTLITKYS